MTVKELYEWALMNDAEDLEIGLLYQDKKVKYSGDTFKDGYDVSARIKVLKEDDYTEAYVVLE